MCKRTLSGLKVIKGFISGICPVGLIRNFFKNEKIKNAISTTAKLLPIHILGPAPNGKKFFDLTTLVSVINRSGLNFSSSFQRLLSLCNPKKKGMIIVFLGNENASNASSSIATRSVIHAAGYKRIASSIVALRYSLFKHSYIVLSSNDLDSF